MPLSSGDVAETSNRGGAVQQALGRLRVLADRTNCVADWNDEHVLDAAASARPGPLHAEPVTVKDWIDVAGFRCSGAETTHTDRRPTADATAVARLRAAGAVVVAKTCVHVDSARFGRVLHPHDSALSPGGSSSGDAAAVAGGAVRLGIGSDSGGSVRVPAAWCGVVGLKPSAGLIPLTGHFPVVDERSDGRTVIGPLATSVDVAWQALKVMSGPDGADAGVAPVALGNAGRVNVASLSVAIGSPGDVPVEGAVLDALDIVRAAMREAGVRDGGRPPEWLHEARRVTEAYWHRERRTGRQVEQDLQEWDAFRRRTLSATRGVDVLVTPTVAEMAPEHREMCVEDYLFCLPASLTGAPAISVPVGNGAVQIIAKRWCDHVAIAVARVVEAAAAAT